LKQSEENRKIEETEVAMLVDSSDDQTSSHSSESESNDDIISNRLRQHKCLKKQVMWSLQYLIC